MSRAHPVRLRSKSDLQGLLRRGAALFGPPNPRVALRQAGLGFFRRLGRGTLTKLSNSSPGRRILASALADEETVAWVDHRLGLSRMKEATVDLAAVPARSPQSFEDLLWLFTPAYASRGLSQLLIDEAGYLFGLLKETPHARVAELGRYKGGTTFLMAAAGANVVSIDTGALDRSDGEFESFSVAIEAALEKAGLGARADILIADAFDYDVAVDSFDVVYLDIYFRDPEPISRLFDHWWPAVKPGGRLILRDGREPQNPGAFPLVRRSPRGPTCCSRMTLQGDT